MGKKLHYIFLYKNDDAISDLVKHFPLKQHKLEEIKQSKEHAFIEFEHFVIRCYKIGANSRCIKGHKAYQVLVEDELYEEMDRYYISDILEPMTYPFDLLGGRVVKVCNYSKYMKDNQDE